MKGCTGSHVYDRIQRDTGVRMCRCGREDEPVERMAICGRCKAADAVQLKPRLCRECLLEQAKLGGTSPPG